MVMATESKTRACPYCKEEIKADAVRCKHCRSAVAPEKPAHGGTCPYCKEAIHPEAIKCKHCGSSVGPAPGGEGCAEAMASPSKPCGCGGAPEASFGKPRPGLRAGEGEVLDQLLAQVSQRSSHGAGLH
jgi:hypothetical protein